MEARWTDRQTAGQEGTETCYYADQIVALFLWGGRKKEGERESERERESMDISICLRKREVYKTFTDPGGKHRN
jgi:hypothetical protein